MTVHFPGFPDEVSEPVELPDIAELLLYPAFQGIDADNFLKFGTEFHKLLLYKTPLRNNRRYVTIRSGVWLLEPGTRSHVNLYGDWHIDGELDEHFHPRQTMFILSSACSALTEFNTRPLDIDIAPGETKHSLLKQIRGNPEQYILVGRQIDPGRIYTFQSHIHQAVDPKRIEFRFFFRVEESDSQVPWNKGPLKQVKVRSCLTGQDSVCIDYGRDRVSVYYPEALSYLKTLASNGAAEH